MKYKVVRNENYDFLGERYDTLFPNIHKYPATMLPQIAVWLLKEFSVTQGKLLDPYCGSGSSFAAALTTGISEMVGYDLNPLAICICRAKFRLLDKKKVIKTAEEMNSQLKNNGDDALKNTTELPKITNIDYWFHEKAVGPLSEIRKAILALDEELQDLFMIPFYETVRECSYTRLNEFKLYRIPKVEPLLFEKDAIAIYKQKLQRTLEIYLQKYYPFLKDQKFYFYNTTLTATEGNFDLVLTSPPYGDSRTTVAYGQFSTFANEWSGIEDARKLDAKLMGGKNYKQFIMDSILSDAVQKIALESEKRALEVSSFYFDLRDSIATVSKTIAANGIVIYIVGNRTVKDQYLRTDQFIAEELEANGLQHVVTYERLLSSKRMPSKNSPSNRSGVTQTTMNTEYIVVCRN